MSNIMEEINTLINKNGITPNPDNSDTYVDESKSKILRCLNCSLIPLLTLNTPSHLVNITCNLGHKFSMNVSQYLEKGLENNFYNKCCSKCKTKIDFKSERKFLYCKECTEIYCKTCIKKHNSIYNKGGSHHLLTLDKFDTTCFVHNESFDYFCKNCNKNICLYCLDDCHRDHDVIDLDDINLKRKEIKRIKECLITEKKNLSLLSDIIHGLLIKFQQEIENILTYKENETKFKESIINTYEYKIDNYNTIMNMKKLEFNEIAFELDDNISTWGNISNFFNYVNDTCNKTFSRGRDNLNKRIRGRIEKSVEIIRRKNNLDKLNSNFGSDNNCINIKKEKVPEKKTEKKISKNKIKYHNMSIKTNLEEDSKKSLQTVRPIKRKHPSIVDDKIANMVINTVNIKSEKVKEKDEKSVGEVNIRTKNIVKKESVKKRVRKENTKNKERSENKKHRENKEKKEYTENSESRESISNRENKERKENKENTENTESKENTSNKDTKESKDTKENKENIENKESNENIENIENKKNIENKENIENKKIKESYENNENDISKDIQEFNNNEKNIIVLGKNKDHLVKIQFGGLLFNKINNVNNDNNDNDDNEDSIDYMEQRYKAITEKKKKFYKKKKPIKIKKIKPGHNKLSNSINVNKIEEIEFTKKEKIVPLIRNISKSDKNLIMIDQANLKNINQQKTLEQPLELNTLEKKDDPPTEKNLTVKTETSDREDIKQSNKKIRKKVVKMKKEKGNKTPLAHMTKKKIFINKKENVKENNNNDNPKKKSNEIEYETEINNLFNIFDKINVDKKNPQNEKPSFSLIDSDNNDIPVNTEESFRHKKIYPKDRKISGDSFKFDFGNNSNITTNSQLKENNNNNNKHRIIEQIYKDSSFIKRKASDDNYNSGNVLDQKQDDDESSIIFNEKNKNIINNNNNNSSKSSDSHIKKIKNEFRRGGVKLTIKESNNSVCSLLEIKDNIFACGFLFGEIDIYNGNTFNCLFSIDEHKDRVNNMYLMKDKSILTSSYDYTMKKIKIDKMDSNEIGPSYSVDFVFDIPSCVIYKGIELSNFNIVSISFGGNITIFNKENDKSYSNFKQHEIAEDEIYDVIELTNNQLAFSTDECLRFFDNKTYQNIDSIFNIEFTTKNNMKQLNEKMLGLLLKNDIGLVDIELRRLIKKISINPIYGKIETFNLLKDKTVLIGITNNKFEEKNYITKVILKQYRYNGDDKMKLTAENIDEIQRNDIKEYSRISSLIELKNGIIVFSTSEYRDNELVGTINIIEE